MSSAAVSTLHEGPGDPTVRSHGSGGGAAVLFSTGPLRFTFPLTVRGPHAVSYGVDRGRPSGVRRGLAVGLICVSLMTRDAEDLFVFPRLTPFYLNPLCERQVSHYGYLLRSWGGWERGG